MDSPAKRHSTRAIAHRLRAATLLVLAGLVAGCGGAEEATSFPERPPVAEDPPPIELHEAKALLGDWALCSVGVAIEPPPIARRGHPVVHCFESGALTRFGEGYVLASGGGDGALVTWTGGLGQHNLPEMSGGLRFDALATVGEEPPRFVGVTGSLLLHDAVLDGEPGERRWIVGDLQAEGGPACAGDGGGESTQGLALVARAERQWDLLLTCPDAAPRIARGLLKMDGVGALTLEWGAALTLNGPQGAVRHLAAERVDGETRLYAIEQLAAETVWVGPLADAGAENATMTAVGELGFAADGVAPRGDGCLVVTSDAQRGLADLETCAPGEACPCPPGVRCPCPEAGACEGWTRDQRPRLWCADDRDLEHMRRTVARVLCPQLSLCGGGGE